jgi:hypothetical protein
VAECYQGFSQRSKPDQLIRTACCPCDTCLSYDTFYDAFRYPENSCLSSTASCVALRSSRYPCLPSDASCAAFRAPRRTCLCFTSRASYAGGASALATCSCYSYTQFSSRVVSFIVHLAHPRTISTLCLHRTSLELISCCVELSWIVTLLYGYEFTLSSALV